MNECRMQLPDEKRIAELLMPYAPKAMSPRDAIVCRRLRADGRRFLIGRLKTSLFRVFKGWRRRQEDVQRHYDRAWADMEWSALLPDSAQKHLMKWGDQYYLGNAQVVGRIHLAFLEEMIRCLRPRRVLEVGCGRGMNLILLAERFPDIEFFGLDLSPSGIQRARQLDAQEMLPRELVQFAPFPVSTRRIPGRIRFDQGSATQLPYSDGHFDFIYTHQALEQMEPYRFQVFSEIHRACGGHAAFFEPFRDWNESGACRNRIIAKDYFAARISDLAGHGFEPVLWRNDLPVKSYMNIGVVLAKRIDETPRPS